MNKVTIAIAAVTILVIIIGVYLITHPSMDGTYRFKKNGDLIYIMIKDNTIQIIERSTKQLLVFTEIAPDTKVYQFSPDNGLIVKFFIDKENKKQLNATISTSSGKEIKETLIFTKISNKVLTKEEADKIV